MFGTFLLILSIHTLKDQACRPPLNKRYKFLPTVSDFMKVDNDGKIIDTGVSVSDFTKKLEVNDDVRKEKNKLLYKKEPVLKLKNLKTFFPVRNGFFGGITSYVKAVNNVSFDVFLVKH